MKINEIILLCILGIQTVWDLKLKQIPTIVTGIGACMGVIYFAYMGREIGDFVLALCPGILFLILAKVTREAIGYGDGMLLITMALLLSASSLWGICILAFSLAGIVALGLLIFFQKKGSFQIPFVPFLLIASVVYMIGG